ncbi:MAG: ABC transporter ATP-binding protein [Candidatus Methanomethylophilaceae archaeon]|nr:ABC transporter ATP-binding protein [Candidatus Methanomethylophilaceae archaeon]
MVKKDKHSRIAEFERYAEGRHHWVTASMIGSAISSILSIVPFYYIWLTVNEALGAGDMDAMIGYGWSAMAFAALSIAVYILSLVVSHFAAFRIAKNMKKTLVEHSLKLSPGAFDDEGSGRIRRVIQDSVESTHEFIAHNQPDLAGMYVLPFAIAALLLVFDWRLGVAALVPVMIGGYISMSMMGRSSMQESMTAWQSSMADVNNKAVEYVRGISVVKIFQQTVDSFQSLNGSIDSYAAYCQGYTEMARRPMTAFFVLVNSCVSYVIVFGVLIIEVLENGEISSGMVSNVIFYVVFTPLISVLFMRIMFSSDQTYRVDDALMRVNEILSIEPLEEPAAPRMPKGFDIAFDNVRFSYSEGLASAIDGVSLELKQGTITALVGPSGSGKSTMAGLAGRFWDPQEGSISIGGIDLRDIGSSNLRSIESYVFQNNRLIKGTLLENVRLGRPQAGPEEVAEALRLAQCEDIVAKMPYGLDTLIGPGGTYLSGGEVQRIAIARAILRDAPIVILDEATAFADPENEHLIQKAFEELSKGRTVLLIAHRLTTIRNADLICVMDRGRIVESGRHDELLSSAGKYRDMWEDYQKALSWKVKEASA